MERPSARPGMRVFVGVLALCAVFALVLGVLSQVLPPDKSRALFYETGPFERASPWLWLGLAVLIVAVFRRASWGVLSGVVLSVASAAREWDLHLSLTGYSVLKPAFYGKDQYPFWQKGLAGAAVLAMFISLFFLVRIVWRDRPWRARPKPAWAWALVFAIAMLVLTKLFDRAPAVLRNDFGIEVNERLVLLMSAWEEGLEMLLAVYFGGVALAYAALERIGPHSIGTHLAQR